METHATLARKLDEATCPEEVFDGVVTSDGLTRAYHRLARLIHPDAVAPEVREESARRFARLVTWRERAEAKLKAGTWGDRKPHFDPVTLIVEGRTLTLSGILAEGLISTVYEATWNGEPCDLRVVAKLVREPGDNDLVEREWTALHEIRQPFRDPIAEREFFAVQRAYVPVPLARFTILDAQRRRRDGILLGVPAGRAFTAQSLRTEKFPGGIEPKHVWWITRRLLLTLWMAHLQGRIHGAITPDHVLIYPEQHGLVLLDWTASARIGAEFVPLADPTWDVPPEVTAKALASVPTDLYGAATVALYLLGDQEKNVAPPIRRLLARCRDPRPGRRPQDAERLHGLLGDLLGKREFAEFVV